MPWVFLFEAASRLKGKARAWMIALAIVLGSSTITFAGYLAWDFEGRIVMVQTEKGKVELRLNPRLSQSK